MGPFWIKISPNFGKNSFGDLRVSKRKDVRPRFVRNGFSTIPIVPHFKKLRRITKGFHEIYQQAVQLQNYDSCLHEQPLTSFGKLDLHLRNVEVRRIVLSHHDNISEREGKTIRGHEFPCQRQNLTPPIKKKIEFPGLPPPCPTRTKRQIATFLTFPNCFLGKNFFFDRSLPKVVV